MIRIGIVGAKNSGKTTLIEKLIPLLSKNDTTIITVKHTQHDHTFDAPGKDSYRHRQAGAKMTLALSKTDGALFFNPDSGFEILIQGLLDNIGGICLVEGDKFSDIRKVLLTRNIESIDMIKIKNIIATYGEKAIDASVQNFAYDEIFDLSEFINKTIDEIEEKFNNE